MALLDARSRRLADRGRPIHPAGARPLQKVLRGITISLCERQIRLGVESGVLVLAGYEARVACGGDHGGVVGGEGAAGKKYAEVVASGFGFEGGAQFAVGGDSAGYEDGAHII